LRQGKQSRSTARRPAHAPGAAAAPPGSGAFPPAHHPARWRGAGVRVLLLSALTVGAYYPAITGQFIWDDDQYVEGNATLRTAAGLRDIWCKPRAIPQYYPLVHTTFWVEYHLWGLNPLGYHVVNVLLHLGNALLFWAVLRRLGVGGAYAAALLFAVHPVMVESAGWITERKNVLSLAFYLWALLTYLRFAFPDDTVLSDAEAPPPRWGIYGLSLLLFLCALLSKTVACTLPVVLLLMMWWKRGRVGPADLWPLVPMLAMGLALGGVTVWLEKTQVGAEGMDWNLSWAGHLLLAGRIPWFYLGKLLWPAEIMFLYPRWTIDPMLWRQYLYPLGVVGLVAALWFLRRRIGRGPLTAVLCFGVGLFPALGFLNVYPMRFSYVADHFQYQASLAIFALVAGAAAAVAGRLGIANLGAIQRMRGLPLGPGACVVGVAAVVLASLTWRQAHDYKDRRALWTHTIRKNPTAWLPYNNLACVLLAEAPSGGMGLYDEAIQACDKSIELKPDAEPYNNRGNAQAGKGLCDAAIRDYDKAIELNPRFAEAYNNRGAAHKSQGRYDEAIRDFDKAIDLRPDARSYDGRGNAYALQGRYEAALRDFDKAIELNPRYAEAYGSRAVYRYVMKAYDLAWADLKTCRQLGGAPNPEFVAALTKASGRTE
jgi:protein O-mannosyl-transferase